MDINYGKSESRVLDVFGPNFVIETNGPVGVGGGVAYQIYSVTDKDYKWQQALHAKWSCNYGSRWYFRNTNR